MMLPPKRDYSMLPLNAEARRIADAWDLAKDKAEADQCRAYGAPAIMRVPRRPHIHWADDNTLQLDIDSGMQTRLFRFGDTAPPAGLNPPSGRDTPWRSGKVGARVLGGAPERGTGQLRVRTTHMRPGYLRKNGVPYSGQRTS